MGRRGEELRRERSLAALDLPGNALDPATSRSYTWDQVFEAISDENFKTANARIEAVDAIARIDEAAGHPDTKEILNSDELPQAVTLLARGLSPQSVGRIGGSDWLRDTITALDAGLTLADLEEFTPDNHTLTLADITDQLKTGAPKDTLLAISSSSRGYDLERIALLLDLDLDWDDITWLWTKGVNLAHIEDRIGRGNLRTKDPITLADYQPATRRLAVLLSLCGGGYLPETLPAAAAMSHTTWADTAITLLIDTQARSGGVQLPPDDLLSARGLDDDPTLSTTRWPTTWHLPDHLASLTPQELTDDQRRDLTEEGRDAGRIQTLMNYGMSYTAALDADLLIGPWSDHWKAPTPLSAWGAPAGAHLASALNQGVSIDDLRQVATTMTRDGDIYLARAAVILATGATPTDARTWAHAGLDPVAMSLLIEAGVDESTATRIAARTDGLEQTALDLIASGASGTQVTAWLPIFDIDDVNAGYGFTTMYRQPIPLELIELLERTGHTFEQINTEFLTRLVRRDIPLTTALAAIETQLLICQDTPTESLDSGTWLLLAAAASGRTDLSNQLARASQAADTIRTRLQILARNLETPDGIEKTQRRVKVTSRKTAARGINASHDAH